MPSAAAPAGVPSHLTPRIGYLIYRVERRLRARIEAAMRAHGVTTTEYVTLSLLRERQGQSCAQLARWSFVTPQAMSLVLAALEEQRLVRRQPDPAHGRILRTSLTARGTRVLESCERTMDGIEAGMLAGLADDDVEVVHAALTSFAHTLEAGAAPPRPRVAASSRTG